MLREKSTGAKSQSRSKLKHVKNFGEQMQCVVL